MEFNVFEYFKGYNRTTNGPRTPEEQGTAFFLGGHLGPQISEQIDHSAAKAGMSLSDYLLREITWMASRPTWDEFFAEVDPEGPIADDVDWAEVIREGREERDRELMARIWADDHPEP